MSSIADSVSVGDVPAGGVASENSWVQAPSPLVTTQAAMMLASALILVCGTTPFPAGVVVRAVPCVESIRLFTVENAFTNPRTLVLLVPTAVVPGFIKGDSAYTAATDETSLTSATASLPSSLQLLRAAIKTALLLSPAPASPPVATTYTCALAEGQVKAPAMLNLPSLSVLTEPLSREVDPVP
jgi:hypothetical protein